jgi:hypothetical protein
MRLLARFLTGFLLALIVFSSTTYGASSTLENGEGLGISPVNRSVTIFSGNQNTSSISVSDFTSQPLSVSLFVKSFNVINYNYNYQFTNPINDWLKLSQTDINLQPGDVQTINYSLNVPSYAPSGGYYYAIFASATVPHVSINLSLQAASIIYLTVGGKLIETSNIVSSYISHFVLGKTINYKINVRNSGNVNYFIYLNTRIHGYLLRPAQTQVAHILLPNTIRTIDGLILSPYLPGVYKIDYGYSTELGSKVNLSAYVVFVPPWSIAVLILLIISAVYYKDRRKKQSSKFK